MQIKVEQHEGKPCGLVVQQEPGERFPTETAFYYALKNRLNADGWDVIKKLMWKDVHMVDDSQYYLRSRRQQRGKPIWAISDGYYAIRLVNVAFNRGEEVYLTVTDLAA